jgi:hypothetical protein
VKTLIKSASSPDDHLKLAAYFKDEALQEETAAKFHDEMAELYESNPPSQEGKWKLPSAKDESSLPVPCQECEKSCRDGKEDGGLSRTVRSNAA